MKDTNPKDAIGARKWRQFMVVPRQVLWEVGVGMLEGALKYGRHNYRASGVRASVYCDAALGHIEQFIEGEDIDRDSGLSHITKAICSLVVLRDAMMNDFWQDDRPPKIKDLDALRDRLQAKVEENFQRWADKNPHHYTQEDGAPYLATRVVDDKIPSASSPLHELVDLGQVSAIKEALLDPKYLPMDSIRFLGKDDPSNWVKDNPSNPSYDQERIVEGLTQAQIDRLVRHEAQRCGVFVSEAPSDSKIWDALCRRVLLRLRVREQLWHTVYFESGEMARLFSRLRSEEWPIAIPGCRVTPDATPRSFA